MNTKIFEVTIYVVGTLLMNLSKDYLIEYRKDMKESTYSFLLNSFGILFTLWAVYSYIFISKYASMKMVVVVTGASLAVSIIWSVLRKTLKKNLNS